MECVQRLCFGIMAQGARGARVSPVGPVQKQIDFDSLASYPMNIFKAPAAQIKPLKWSRVHSACCKRTFFGAAFSRKRQNHKLKFCRRIVHYVSHETVQYRCATASLCRESASRTFYALCATTLLPRSRAPGRIADPVFACIYVTLFSMNWCKSVHFIVLS